jgi:hypothetical protein
MNEAANGREAMRADDHEKALVRNRRCLDLYRRFLRAFLAADPRRVLVDLLVLAHSCDGLD